MLVEWLASAGERHELRVAIHGAGTEALERACRDAGLPPPLASYAAQGGALGDFAVTWRLLGRLPAETPVLLAPGVLQKSLSQWLALFLRRRRVAGYVPMAYSSRQMRFRGGRLRDWVAGCVIRRVDLWITISSEQRELLQRVWRIAAPVLVVPNRLALLGERAPPGPAAVEGRLRVLFAGRFDANQKGLDWLCERLRARGDAWTRRMRFLFKGEGPFREELLRLRDEVGGQHVEVAPWGDVAGAMAQADVLLLPSRYEGVPLVVLEATHYGVPVVASRQAGVADLVAPQYLFDFGDERGMWAALEALRDPARRAAALAHSRRRVAQRLSAASFRRQVDRVVAAFARLA